MDLQHATRAKPKFQARRPMPSPEALGVLRDFAAGAQAEIEAGLAQGVAFATEFDGIVAWVHPDGTIRTARAEDSPLLDR